MIKIKVPDEDSAAKVADKLLRLELSPNALTYPQNRGTLRWKGNMECLTEFIVQIKCPIERSDEAVDAIRACHPLDQPEFLIEPIPEFKDQLEALMERHRHKR